MTDASRTRAVQALVDNHRRFLDFLERRTGSRIEAEDLLQSAFVRALQKADDLRSDESAVAWFSRTLRRALIDHYRARAAGGHALEGLARESAAEPEDPDLRAEACRCVLNLLPTLKAEYADLLRRVDLGHEGVQEAARAIGISASNGAVRLHRARKALLREVQRSCRTCATHGCLDCTCGRPGTA